MKKIISAILLFALAACTLAACGGEPATETEKTYSLSIGVATEIDDATATVESTVAAVVTDEEGKIVLARLDAISYTAEVDVTTGAPKKVLPTSKYELGENYGMDDYSNPPAIGEWYEQALAYAGEAKGKNPTALDSLPTEGVAGCTMYAGGYKTVLAKAGKALR